MASFSELQSWFLTVMTAAGGVERGVGLAGARFGWRADDVVAHDSGAPALARMNIYAEGYVLRLLECLRADYPVLRRVMGDELFAFFAKAYIWSTPSRSPTLYDLGAGFADFLQGSRPGGAGADDLLNLPVELARLERARTEAIRAPGLERLAPDGRAPASAFDAMLGKELELTLPPCVRLLALTLPLLPFWDAVQGGAEVPAAPAPATSHVAVARVRYQVGLHPLESWQYHFLKALADAGAAALPSQHCAALAAAGAAMPVEQVVARAMLWLPLAAASGMVRVAGAA